MAKKLPLLDLVARRVLAYLLFTVEETLRLLEHACILKVLTDVTFSHKIDNHEAIYMYVFNCKHFYKIKNIVSDYDFHASMISRLNIFLQCIIQRTVDAFYTWYKVI